MKLEVSIHEMPEEMEENRIGKFTLDSLEVFQGSTRVSQYFD
jgi:hypothetical protein